MGKEALFGWSFCSKTPFFTVYIAERQIISIRQAHERPEELVEDIRDFLGKAGPAYGVVKGRNGYADGTEGEPLG
jgi:hypothetical protein